MVSKRNSGSTDLKRMSKKSSGTKLVKPTKSKRAPRSFQDAVELDELKQTIDQWFKETGEAEAYKKIAIGSSVAGIGLLAMVLGMFSALIPLTYGVGGWVLYRNKGWNFYQPGVGGSRFVALNAFGWALYAISVLLQVGNFVVHDPLLTFNVYMLGSLSYVLILGALFSYYPPKGKKRQKSAVSVPNLDELNDETYYETPVFNDELQHSVLMRADDNSPSAFWWVFIGMQLALVITSFLVCVVGSVSTGPMPIRMITVTFAMWTFSAACASTHALGGKWRHIQTNYAAFQPGKGGPKYIAAQAIAWSMFGVSILAGLGALASQVRIMGGKKPLAPGLMAVCGVLGLLSELLIIASLFMFEDHETEGSEEVDVKGFNKMVAAEEDSFLSRVTKSIVQAQFDFINMVYGPSDPDAATRDPVQRDPDAHLGCEEKWARVTAHCSDATGDCYLVVGNGFVGKRLVNRLLERGETNIRVFDIVENNHWKGDDRVTFYRGDVTKADQIGKACEGVDTVYSTFAIIQFFARLEHQAFISYHINVTGTEVLLEAMKENNVRRCIVTSSSHATTDEHTAPRFDRDESAKLLTRKEAHNHYGWTKAIADELSLAADGSKTADGGELNVCVVRPCSGVFGADDRLSFEKVMDMRCAPGVGAESVMDWVYVENVVLGHLLAEAGLQDGRDGVKGEAFCVSNDDPVSMQDFWMLTRKHIQLMPSKRMRDRLMINFLWIPMGPLWALAYISEFNQWLFKGKVSLGKDLDILTPGTLSTATMSYSYKSDKARKVLGYEPVFNMDEAIQRSLNEYYDNHYKSKTA